MLCRLREGATCWLSPTWKGWLLVRFGRFSLEHGLFSRMFVFAHDVAWHCSARFLLPKPVNEAEVTT